MKVHTYDSIKSILKTNYGKKKKSKKKPTKGI